MKTLKTLLGAAAAVAVLGLSAPAEAQYYYPQPQPRGYYPQQPTYVPPRILRKQREMERRVYQKYGYAPPQQRYGYGRGYGNPYRQPGYGNPYRQPGYGYSYGSPYAAPSPYGNPGYLRRGPTQGDIAGSER